jgi:hypothetical protein
MKLRIVCLIFAISVLKTSNGNPIKDFCSKKHIDQKCVVVSISLQHCASCIKPPSSLLQEIRKINSYIPVFVVTKDTLTETEFYFLRKLFGDSLRGVEFLYDRTVYDYMMLKKKGIPSVCCASKGKILAFKHLKEANLDDLYKAIVPTFEVTLLEKVALQNKLISTQKYTNLVQVGNRFYTFHAGVKLLCKYNANGENLSNLFLDSLKIDYMQLSAQLFTPKVYKPIKLTTSDRSKLTTKFAGEEFAFKR